MAESVVIPALCSWALGCVALRSPQAQRLIAFGPLVASWTYAFVNAKHLISNQRYAGIFVWFMLFYLGHMINTLLVAQHALPDRSWRTTYFWLFNGRWIGTEHSTERARVRNRLAGTKTLKLSRKQFALRKLASLLTKYFVMVIYYEFIDLPERFDLVTADFSPSKRVLIRRLINRDPSMSLQRESLVRSWAVFTWFFEDFMALSGIHDFLALVSVGVLGLDNADDWPSLFGHLSDVTSLRTWYSQFWHLMIYRYGVNISQAVVAALFGFQSTKTGSRTLVTCFVFLLSALNHLGHEWSIYGSLNWRSFTWWAAQPALLAMEDLGQKALATCFPMLLAERYAFLRRSFGKIWVFAIFFWGLLKFQFID